MADAPAIMQPHEIGLGAEVAAFETVADKVALGDLEIRKRFALHVMLLFIATNAFVMAGLGLLAWHESAELAARLIVPADRIVDSKVVMTLLGATTVQLGTVIYTIARAIFPGPPGGR